MIERRGSERKTPISRRDILFLAGVGVFLYTQLFQFPFTPYYFDGDQMISVSNGMRLLAGEVMYRDFFHMTPPGAEVVYASLFGIFGVKVWVLNLVVLFLCLAISVLTWQISRHLMSGAFAYIPTLILMVVGFRPFFNDGSYRLFSMVCVLAAVVVLMEGRTIARIISSGVLCGLASFSVQPRGVLALGGIILFLGWECYRDRAGIKALAKNVSFIVSFFLFTVAATNIYFIWAAGFDNYYFSLVTFVQTNYQHDPLSNATAFFADIPSLGRFVEMYGPLTAVSRFFRISAPLLLFYFLPLAYFVFLVLRLWKKDLVGSEETDAKLVLLCLVGIPLIAGISAPSGFRFAHVSMPALIVLVWLVSKVRHAKVIGSVSLAVLACMGLAYSIQRQTVEKYYLDLPAGRSAFLSRATYEKFEWIGEQVTPGEIFYEPYHPGFYFPFHLVNPTAMYLIRDSEYSPKPQINGVLASLRNTPPEIIIWPSKWTKPPVERLPGDHLAPLQDFLEDNYEPERFFSMASDETPYTIGDVEVWRRKK